MSDNDNTVNAASAPGGSGGGCLGLIICGVLLLAVIALCHRGCSLYLERQEQESRERLEGWRTRTRARVKCANPMLRSNLPRYYCPVCEFERPFWRVIDTDLLECDTCSMRTTHWLLTRPRPLTRREQLERLRQYQVNRHFERLLKEDSQRKEPHRGESQP